MVRHLKVKVLFGKRGEISEAFDLPAASIYLDRLRAIKDCFRSTKMDPTALRATHGFNNDTYSH